MGTLAPNHGQNSVRGVPLRSASPITSNPWVSTWSCRAVDLLSGVPEESVIVGLPVQICWVGGREGGRGRQSQAVAELTLPADAVDPSAARCCRRRGRCPGGGLLPRPPDRQVPRWPAASGPAQAAGLRKPPGGGPAQAPAPRKPPADGPAQAPAPRKPP